MKRIILIALIAMVFGACENDEERAYVIKYVMRADTDSAIQMIWPRPEPIFWVTRSYEHTDTIKENDATYYAYIECQCKDSATTMIGEIYIDGELKATKEAKSWLRVSYQFK